MKLIPGAIVLMLASGSAIAAPGELPDQYGRIVSLDQFLKQPVLAIVASGRKLRQIKSWEEGLRKEHPELVSVRIADINVEPRPTYDQVATKLRKRAPEGVSIMIDLDNLWAANYGLDTNEPCLLLFDADGELVADFRGRANKTRLVEVSAALDELLPATAAHVGGTP